MDPSPTREATPGRAGGGRTLLVGVAVVAVVLVAVGVFAAVGQRREQRANTVTGASEAETTLADRPRPGERFRLPDRVLAGFGGEPDVDLARFAGEPLVVNFWATWCAPCVKEMPAFAEVAADLEGEVTFLGVNVQDAAADAEPFAADLGVSYPLATDADASFYREVRAYGMPTTLFVRADGTVVYRHTGALESEQLRALLAERLGVAS